VEVGRKIKPPGGGLRAQLGLVFVGYRADGFYDFRLGEGRRASGAPSSDGLRELSYRQRFLLIVVIGAAVAASLVRLVIAMGAS
jgi:hypothetical protein